MRSKVTGAKRWVVKIGSALLTADGKGLDRGAMAVWVEQMVALVADTPLKRSPVFPSVVYSICTFSSIRPRAIPPPATPSPAL